MKKAYLITGAAGHLASAAIEKLRRTDCSIRGLILPGEPGVSDGQIRYFRGDVTRPETLDAFFSGLEDSEVFVLHMAAIISIQRKVSPAVYDVNVNGTRNMIAKCFQYPVKRLVYVSSVHAIPEPERISTVTEIDHFSGDAVEGAYAVTKAEATQLVLDAGQKGLDVVVVHPSGITGPGDLGRNHLTQLAQLYLRHRLPMGVRGGYDFVDVRDAAEGTLRAAERGRSGECYLLSNRYVSIPEFLELMRIAAGRKKHTACCPLWLARAVAPSAESIAGLRNKRPILTGYSMKVLATKARFCHDKATREIGYRPRGFQETVADTISFLMAHHALLRAGLRQALRPGRLFYGLSAANDRHPQSGGLLTAFLAVALDTGVSDTADTRSADNGIATWRIGRYSALPESPPAFPDRQGVCGHESQSASG